MISSIIPFLLAIIGLILIMQKKKLVVISIFIIGGVCLVINSKTNNIKSKRKKNIKKNRKVKTKCIPFRGGSFNIIFNTDDGEEIPNMGFV